MTEARDPGPDKAWLVLVPGWDTVAVAVPGSVTVTRDPDAAGLTVSVNPAPVPSVVPVVPVPPVVPVLPVLPVVPVLSAGLVPVMDWPGQMIAPAVMAAADCGRPEAASTAAARAAGTSTPAVLAARRALM
jgi:hypothetical protein